MKLFLIPLLALSSAVSAAPDNHTRALAAGYKAAFLCSGMFTAGQTEAQVTADDLTGIYADYADIVPTLTASIDPVAKTVAVAFDPALPPRIAAWRPRLGCAQLPIGAPMTAVADLPRLDSVTAPDLDAQPWPMGDIGAVQPLPKSKRAKLDAAVAKAFDRASFGAGTETTAVVVIAEGRIVAERYRDGYGPHVPQRTWSVAKSITGTLVGRAAELSFLDPAAPAPVPDWQSSGDPRATITLNNLLQMNSGLWTNGPGNRTDEVYVGGATVEETAATMPVEVAAGTRFNYANNDTLLAARALRWATNGGRRALEFPFTELFWRIGMTRTTPETDWRGNFVLSSQVWTTARDLGRLGLLYLADGKWGEDQLLPKGWATFVSTPASAQPAGAKPGTIGYGATFWTFGGVADLPADSYAMLGNRGQIVMIIPSRNTVIVRRGFDKTGGTPFDAARFAKSVLDALPATP